MSGIVVGLDYPGRRESAALAALDWASIGVRFVPLIRTRPPAVASGRQYAADLLDELRVERCDIVAIAAFCAAGPLAHELAQLLVEAACRPSPLILFDVDPCPAISVMDGFDTCLRQTARHEIRPESRKTLYNAIADGPERFLVLAADILTDRIRSALRDEGISDDPFAAELLTSYLNYLAYLVAAHHTTRPRWGGEAYHVTSRHHPDSGPWPGAVRTHSFRLDVDADRLLDSPTTSHAIARCMRLIDAARGLPCEFRTRGLPGNPGGTGHRGPERN
jgi:hypothetical protein